MSTTDDLRSAAGELASLDLRATPAPAVGASLPVSLPSSDQGRPWADRALVGAADITTLGLSLCLGLWGLELVAPSRATGPKLPAALLFVPSFLLALLAHGMYRRDPQELRRSVLNQIKGIALALGTGVLLELAGDAVLGARGRQIKLSEAVAFALPALILIPVGRVVAFHIVPIRRRAMRVVILGSGTLARTVEQRLRRCSDVFVIGRVAESEHRRDAPGDNGRAWSRPTLGTVPDLKRIALEHRADRVIVGVSDSQSEDVLDQLRNLPPNVGVSLVPRFYEILSWRSRVEELHGIPIVHVAPPQLSRLSKAAKRSVDLLVAAGVVLLLLPVFLAIALTIKLTSPGPVFFRQERTGLNGHPFLIFKFRTMCAGAETMQVDLSDANEVDGPIFKMRSDPRITRAGALLRKTSIDELPQLLNVLLGHMSLVGPRPFPVEEARRITGPAARRIDVLPGITGLWQVCGRSDLSYDDLQHLDSVYVSSWSLSWDFRILLQTPATVLRQHGAF